MYKDFLLSTSLPTFVLCRLSDDSLSDMCEVIPHCSFDFHFSENERRWSFFHLPVSYLYIFFEKDVYLGLLPIFWIGLFVCLFVCLFLKRNLGTLVLSLGWFIYLWLNWVFVSVRGLSLVAASGGHSSSRCAGLSLSRPLLLRSTGSRRAGSVIVAHGPSCSTACGIFPDQGSNPCPLHWQADSQPLRHQGSPGCLFFWYWVVWAIYIFLY